MHIKHLKYTFSNDKVVPVDILPIFGRYYYNAIYPGVFMEAISFLVDPYY